MKLASCINDGWPFCVVVGQEKPIKCSVFGMEFTIRRWSKGGGTSVKGCLPRRPSSMSSVIRVGGIQGEVPLHDSINCKEASWPQVPVEMFVTKMTLMDTEPSHHDFNKGELKPADWQFVSWASQ